MESKELVKLKKVLDIIDDNFNVVRFESRKRLVAREFESKQNALTFGLKDRDTRSRQ